MKVCLIDADLIRRTSHRFPNLAVMKLSGYHKDKGDNVKLKIDYDELDLFDVVYISKVFTDTKIPKEILNQPNVKYGGTGFFYDKAPYLSYEIEHHMPDYDLYKDYVNTKLRQGDKKNKWKYYLDYSIGYSSRGCFRKCGFCVNKRYSKSIKWSPINEFLNQDKKQITLLDDNILACKDWRKIIEKLQATNKRFEFKQGIDIRLMTEEKAKILSNCKCCGDYIFAFDDINDRELIEDKLKIWFKYNNRTTKLYVLCGYDKNNKYDFKFWKHDIINTFERIRILMKYGCLPYIMRFKKYKDSPYYGMYINLARWCNQPNFYKKKSFREFCLSNGSKSASVRYLSKFESAYPEISKIYFDLKFDQLNKYKTHTKKAVEPFFSYI